MATREEWDVVIAIARQDEGFKRLLETDPATAFRECDIEPERIIQVLPHPDDMSDEQLEVIQPNEEGSPPFSSIAMHSTCYGRMTFNKRDIPVEIHIA